MRILSPIGKRGWSPGLVKRDQPARGADPEGRSRNAFPQSDRARGGAFFGVPNEERSRSGPVKRRGWGRGDGESEINTPRRWQLLLFFGFCHGVGGARLTGPLPLPASVVARELLSALLCGVHSGAWVSGGSGGEPVASGGWSSASGPRCRMAAAVRMNIQMLLEAADYLERRERGARGREESGPSGDGGSEGPSRRSGCPAAPGVVGGAESATASAPNPSSSPHARSEGRPPLPQRQ